MASREESDSVVKKVTMKKGVKEKLSVQESEELRLAGDYQCTGNLELDYTELCFFHGISEIPKIVHRIHQVTPASEKIAPEEAENTVEKATRISRSLLHERFSYFQPRILVDLENEDPKSVRDIYIRGWKIDEKMMDVFSKCLPASQTLHSINLWNVGLTDNTFELLTDTLLHCPNLKTLVLDGNPLPQQTYFKLFSEDSTLAHVTLRNNKIDNEGVWFLAQALLELQLASKHLVSLNLSYNHISDTGASYLAEVLRMNRSLLYLSLSHNEIGDEGALYLAEILGYFALTTQEVVERRYLLLNKESLEHSRLPSPIRIIEGKVEHPQQLPSCIGVEKAEKGPATKSIKSASKKKEKREEQPKKEEKAVSISLVAGSGQGGPIKKEDLKLKKQAGKSEEKARGKERKSATKEKPTVVPEPEPPEPAEVLHPLLEPVEYRDGHVFLLGNRTLINLNLAMNKITERGLKGFLVSLESQGLALKNLRGTHSGTGLLRLSVGRNNFSSRNPTFLKLQEVMAGRDPILKAAAKAAEEEQAQA
ncbi:leucine-rich repeat-containing protein 71 isoform X2 [Microcaecilia unicolor]|uniref:Leucine-rich repeat-containing protein 71 isoform X2 n=1 Tax=Microcaecilia unicolor TaxID=1415580 RepID=A0A6P7WQH0_9AMPH|nr:leucine-rich repeat-containing protein 71 isoform X2 [Microcaecilia unicolor]